MSRAREIANCLQPPWHSTGASLAGAWCVSPSTTRRNSHATSCLIEKHTLASLFVFQKRVKATTEVVIGLILCCAFCMHLSVMLCNCLFLIDVCFSETMPDPLQPALRVAQLDAHSLDGSFVSVLVEQASRVIESLPSGLSAIMRRLEPEIRLSIRSLLFYGSVAKTGSEI